MIDLRHFKEVGKMDSVLVGKTMVVTGATAGIGLATVEALLQQQAAVIGVGRSVERCTRVAEQLATRFPEARVAYCVADLSIQQQVRALAREIRQQLEIWQRSALDGLVNNAGTFTFWQTLTPEGFELQWAVNHLAPFLLTVELLPLLQAAPAARVVTVSSGSHYGAQLPWEDLQLRRHYNGLRAYKQTKLANVLFTAELNRRLGSGSTVKAFAADPGLVNTEIGLKSNSWLARRVWEYRRRGGITPAESARGILFLLSEPALQESPHVYWKHGRPQRPNAYALNPEVARRLWQVSAQMCGLLPNEPTCPLTPAVGCL